MWRCGPDNVVQNYPLRNPPTLKLGLVALVNLMRVIPNHPRSLCRHYETSNTLSMFEEEVYAIMRAQKDQVSILESQSTKQRNSSPQEQLNVGKYPDPVVEQAKLVAIKNWINEDRRKYEKMKK